jgi:hypothetical protein
MSVWYLLVLIATNVINMVVAARLGMKYGWTQGYFDRVQHEQTRK